VDVVPDVTATGGGGDGRAIDHWSATAGPFTVRRTAATAGRKTEIPNTEAATQADVAAAAAAVTRVRSRAATRTPPPKPVATAVPPSLLSLLPQDVFTALQRTGGDRATACKRDRHSRVSHIGSEPQAWHTL